MLCLDNAKAFDRLQHAFMIEVLRAFNLPEDVVRAVKTLYSNAETRLKLNGRLSPPFPKPNTSGFFFFFLTTVKTRRASLNNLSSSQLRTAVGRSLLADRLTGYPAGPCARIPQASWSTTPAVGGYLIPRESAVPKSG
jgi:hypothetical protein